MKRINRGVVIIRPREPLLEWVNHNPTLSSSITMQHLQSECTAILVPELYSLEHMLEWLEPLNPWLFELELGGWYLDPDTWPAERTPETFDAWFKLEPHSMVWDAVAASIVKEESQVPIDLTGTWHVVSSPDFDDDYLYMETTPQITLRQSGSEMSGDFHIGLIVGSLFGRREGNRALFGFEATDEMDPVTGFGTMSPQGEQMILKLAFHLGDEFTFECEPAREIP